MNDTKRIFVDMDGTLFKWNEVMYQEQLLEEGYFLDLEPNKNLVDAIKTLIAEKEYEIFVLSAYLPESKYALKEKNESLDKYLPEIDIKHRVFMKVGENKSEFIPEGIRNTDILIDDYTLNLNQWKEAGGLAVKCLNGINDFSKKWYGERLNIKNSKEIIISELKEKIQPLKLSDIEKLETIKEKPNEVKTERER